MADTSRLRWIILVGALAGTVAACLFPADEPVAPARRANRAIRVAPPTPKLTSPQPRPLEAVDVDPFAPRTWQAVPQPQPAAVIAPPAPQLVGPMPPPPPTPPAPPPPLPFQFMGRLSDGAAPVVYLSHGEQTLVARGGEILEQTYKVLGIGPTQIEFLYLPTGEKQLMGLPAPGD